MTGAEREKLRLRQWAMRASDMINKVSPARAPHLGTSCDYARDYLTHGCHGGCPVRWETVYRDVLTRLEVTA